jgi:hypothetical protein
MRLVKEFTKKFSQIFAEKVADSRRDPLSFFKLFCETLRLAQRNSARNNFRSNLIDNDLLNPGSIFSCQPDVIDPFGQS